MAAHDTRLIEHALEVLLAMAMRQNVAPSAAKLACRVLAPYVGTTAMKIFYDEWSGPVTMWGDGHLRMRLEGIAAAARSAVTAPERSPTRS